MSSSTHSYVSSSSSFVFNRASSSFVFRRASPSFVFPSLPLGERASDVDEVMTGFRTVGGVVLGDVTTMSLLLYSDRVAARDVTEDDDDDNC